MPDPFIPAHPRIETDRLTIRLVDAADLPALLVVNSDDEVTRFLPYATWAGIADAEAWLARMSLRAAAGDAGQFVIVQRASARVIGACLLFRYDAGSSRAELGYVLARDCWGAGYMIEAMSGFIDFAFREVGLRRLEAEIDPRNGASARLAERLGFVREGLLRQRWTSKGADRDSAFYGLLRDEWRGAPT